MNRCLPVIYERKQLFAHMQLSRAIVCHVARN